MSFLKDLLFRALDYVRHRVLFDPPDFAVPITRQLNPAPKRTEKRLLEQERVDGIKAIYDRGAEVLPADYLTCHQPGDPNAVHTYRALRKQKKLLKAAKRNASQTANL